MLSTSSTRTFGRFGVAAVIAAVSGLAHAALADVEVEITEIRGAAAVKRAGTDEWVELKEGDVLKQGDKVRLPGNFTEVHWKRTDADSCGNTGSVGTGLSKVKEVEVGKEIRSAAPPATYFHAVSDGEQNGGEVTVFESGDCFEAAHCGVSSDLAAAAAMDPTPHDTTTILSLETALDADGMACETFIGNHPASPIPVFTSALFGPWSNQLLPIAPGEAVQWVRMNSGEVVPFFMPYHSVFCSADFNDDGAVDTRDVLEFLNAWSAGAPGADFNGDDTVDTRDVLEFLNAWTQGCE